MRSLILMLLGVLAAGTATFLSIGEPRLLFTSAPVQPQPAPSAPLSGPAPEAVAALSAQLDEAAPEQVQATIQAMVSGLRTRLEEQGGSASEWDRLVRSYATLEDLDGLRFALDGLLALEPENAQALILAGQAAAEAGERRLAKGYFQRLIPLIDPEHPRFEQIKALIDTFDQPAEDPAPN